MQVQPYNGRALAYDPVWLEGILLHIGDVFEIRIVWDGETAVLTGVFTLLGGVLGGIVGGRLGATLGAGIGGATGLGVSAVVSLREIWETVKQQLQGLMQIIFNCLRRLHPDDYLEAFKILMSNAANKKQLVIKICKFIAEKLGREVLSHYSARAIQ